MTPLKPTDYQYLLNPLLADGGELIKRCLQHLCLEKVLHIEERWVYVDKRESKKRPRLFFRKGEYFNQYVTHRKSEQFFLKAFDQMDELSLTQIRWHIKNKFGRDVQAFSNYVYNDLNNQNYCHLRFFPSITAVKECRLLKMSLRNVEKNIDYLIQNPSLLQKELAFIGSNLIFLDKQVLEKLSRIDKNVENIGLLKFLQDSDSFNSLDMLVTIGYMGGLDSFDSVDFSGGFDGMGGESGGGGSDGDW